MHTGLVFCLHLISRSFVPKTLWIATNMCCLTCGGNTGLFMFLKMFWKLMPGFLVTILGVSVIFSIIFFKQNLLLGARRSSGEDFWIFAISKVKFWKRGLQISVRGPLYFGHRFLSRWPVKYLRDMPFFVVFCIFVREYKRKCSIFLRTFRSPTLTVIHRSQLFERRFSHKIT